MRQRYPGVVGAYRPAKRGHPAPTPEPTQPVRPAARPTASRRITLPIFARTRELGELRERLSRTETVKRVIRDEREAITAVRERAEPVADPDALAQLNALAAGIGSDWPAMSMGERIQIGDALARTLRVAEAHYERGSLADARGILDAMLRAEGLE